MSFVIKQVTSIKEKIIIEIPTDLGRLKRAEIVVEYRKLPVSETKKLLEDSAAGEANDDEVLRENIINIDGLLDEDKNKVPYNDDVLDQLLEMEYVRRPLIKKLMEVVVGRGALQAKN